MQLQFIDQIYLTRSIDFEAYLSGDQPLRSNHVALQFINTWPSWLAACDDSAIDSVSHDGSTWMEMLARSITSSQTFHTWHQASQLDHQHSIRGAIWYDRYMEITLLFVSSSGVWSLGRHQPRFQIGADHQDHLWQTQTSEVDHEIVPGLPACQGDVDQASSTADHAHKVTHDIMTENTSPCYWHYLQAFLHIQGHVMIEAWRDGDLTIHDDQISRNSQITLPCCDLLWCLIIVSLDWNIALMLIHVNSTYILPQS